MWKSQYPTFVSGIWILELTSASSISRLEQNDQSSCTSGDLQIVFIVGSIAGRSLRQACHGQVDCLVHYSVIIEVNFSG